MLNQYVKAWRDKVRFNRHLLHQNIAAIKFGEHN